MREEIEKILLKVINDFNGKWTNHDEKNKGVSEYTEQINNLFPTQSPSLVDEKNKIQFQHCDGNSINFKNSPSLVSEETYWLIENENQEWYFPQFYWEDCGNGQIGRTRALWLKDANKALKFNTQKEALEFADGFSRFEFEPVKITEHQFINSTLLVKEGEKDSEDWISVSEKLPDKSKYYLCSNGEPYLPFISMFHSDINKWTSDGDYVTPKFYKTIPNPPKQEQQKTGNNG